jgi:transposase
MWKPEHRLTADRRSLRSPSDLSDAEWVLVAPMIPPARRGRRRPQRKRLFNRRCRRPRSSNHGCPWIQKSS